MRPPIRAPVPLHAARRGIRRQRRLGCGVLAGRFARMRSTPPASRHWDGSPVLAHRARRSLQVTPDGVSRLLRCGQSDRCRECGNRIEWYHRSNRRPVRLHPHELPAARVPVACRWHVSSGVAHPAGDGSSWCRLPHAVVCPARDTPPSPPRAGRAAPVAGRAFPPPDRRRRLHPSPGLSGETGAPAVRLPSGPAHRAAAVRPLPRCPAGG